MTGRVSPPITRVRRSARRLLWEAFCLRCSWVGPPRTVGVRCVADGAWHAHLEHAETEDPR